ncbi:MAG: hypothetical protein IPN42_10570 [Methylococcaceae bacterium]|nr:hypothetical protein [Methylococcaceae bacterium]
MKIWYEEVCTKQNNNHDLIIKHINSLTNNQIIKELAKLTQQNEKYIWENGAVRWFMTNGSSVWGSKKDQGRKPKNK